MNQGKRDIFKRREEYQCSPCFQSGKLSPILRHSLTLTVQKLLRNLSNLFLPVGLMLIIPLPIWPPPCPAFDSSNYLLAHWPYQLIARLFFFLSSCCSSMQETSQTELCASKCPWSPSISALPLDFSGGSVWNRCIPSSLLHLGSHYPSHPQSPHLLKPHISNSPRQTWFQTYILNHVLQFLVWKVTPIFFLVYLYIRKYIFLHICLIVQRLYIFSLEDYASCL